MKLISINRASVLIRQSNLNRKKQLRISGVSRHRKQRGPLGSKAGMQVTTIRTPKTFELKSEQNRRELVDLIKIIAEHLAKGNRVKLCFRNTTSLQPCGTLYFVANIESLLIAFPGKIDCTYPEDDVVEQLFQHIGFLEKLGKQNRKVITAENVVNWHFATGTDASTSAFQALLFQHQDAMGGELTRSELYDCMSEAVTNTKKHAYPVRSDKSENRWWMFSQAADNKLTVAICDLGIGIPDSLLMKKELSDYIRDLRGLFRVEQMHKRLLKVAVSSNRSRTGLPYRGKGLPQMLDFIKTGNTGGFRVQSGYGLYTYSADEKKTLDRARKCKIRGTLVQWTLPLST